MKFSLIKQLFIVSLCTLLLPWTGCQYVREMETLIRQQQTNTLLAFTKPLAENIKKQAVFQSKLQQIEKRQTLLFAPLSQTPIVIDGYADEWLAYYESALKSRDPNSHHQLKAATFGDHLYLFLSIQDNQADYYNPTKAALKHNDWLKIATPDTEFHLFTSAPGSTQVLRYNPGNKQRISSQQISGYWQENSIGYQVELKIPLDLVAQGVRIDVFNHANGTSQLLASSAPFANRAQFIPLLIPSSELARWLTPYGGNQWDLQIVDDQGWPLVARLGDSQTEILQPALITRDNLGALLLNSLYRFFLETTLPVRFSYQWPLHTTQLSHLNQRIPMEQLLAQQQDMQQPFSRWYALSEYNQSALLVVHPIKENNHVLGYVIATQTEKAWLSFTNDALRRVMNLSLLSFGVLVVILLGYATLLSLRIKTLKQKAQQAVSSDGSIKPFQPSGFADELGALSQSYAALLSRVKNYNDYLQSLTHKLAHEIRTPLAIVKSSLEMLQSVAPEQQATYLERALQGNQRLANILNAMSESTQVEQLVQRAELTPLDLNGLLQELTQAYQGAYPHYQFKLSTREACRIKGNPELLAQLIDKLVDNARDFTPEGETIELSASCHNKNCRLAVSNPGSQLPEQMTHQLFDSLISIRERKENSEGTHLGLGLYIVRLIAHAHNATVAAHNLPDQQGVCFTVDFPGLTDSATSN